MIGSTERHILENITKKRKQQELLKNSMDISVKEIQKLNFEGKEVKRADEFVKIEMPEFI